MKFVLDASVALSWLLEDAGPGQEYAVAVFDTLTRVDTEAHVPVTWDLELANVIAKCEARGNLLEGRSQAFLAGILAAPIIPDPATYDRSLHETPDLARRRSGQRRHLGCGTVVHARVGPRRASHN